ncbi:hypothetical protein EDC01DRAFT_661048, partial [Geopyxis carbonaria]
MSSGQLPAPPGSRSSQQHSTPQGRSSQLVNQPRRRSHSQLPDPPRRRSSVLPIEPACELPDLSDEESAVSTSNGDSESERGGDCGIADEQQPREWVLATSASDHMTGEFCAFFPGSYRAFKANETRLVQLFGGKQLEAIGKGLVYLLLPNQSKTHTVFSTLFVPALNSKGGYISSGKLSEHGWILAWSESGNSIVCTLRKSTQQNNTVITAIKTNNRYIFPASRAGGCYYGLHDNEFRQIYRERNDLGFSIAPWNPPHEGYKRILRSAPFSTEPGDTEPSDSESDYATGSEDSFDDAVSVASWVSEEVVQSSGHMHLAEWKARLKVMVNQQLDNLSEDDDWARWERNFMRRMNREMRKLPVDRKQKSAQSHDEDEDGRKGSDMDGASAMKPIKIEPLEAGPSAQPPDTPRSKMLRI